MGDPIAILTLVCAALAVVLLLVNLFRAKTAADPEAARSTVVHHVAPRANRTGT